MRRVFLSHSSSDLDEVVRFDCQLRRHGVPLWRDRIDLPKGSVTEEEIRRAGDNALGFAFYLTRNAAESEWVRVKELGHALRNKALNTSFGIVPVFRHNHDEIAEFMLTAAKNGDPKQDLRVFNGHIIRSSDQLDIDRELATAADIVLRSSLRTVRKNAPVGSRLRIAAVTRHTKPWNSSPGDLAIDWSELYPPTSGKLPDNGTGSTQLLPPLRSLVKAIEQEWKDTRVQLVPHCHPSMALAVGFAFRRGTGFDLEVLDHAGGLRAPGPSRPAAPAPGVWNESVEHRRDSSRNVAVVIGVSRDITPDATRALIELGVEVGAIVSLSPPGGHSNTAIPTDDPELFHRMAVAGVQRIVDFQTRRGVGAVHLFLAVPGTLAVLIGQQLTNLGVVQVYDFDNQRQSYSPVFELTHQ